VQALKDDKDLVDKLLGDADALSDTDSNHSPSRSPVPCSLSMTTRVGDRDAGT